MYTILLVIQVVLVIFSIVTLILMKKAHNREQWKMRDLSVIMNLIGTYIILILNLFAIEPIGKFTPNVSYVLSFFNLITCILILYVIGLQKITQEYEERMREIKGGTEV